MSPGVHSICQRDCKCVIAVATPLLQRPSRSHALRDRACLQRPRCMSKWNVRLPCAMDWTGVLHRYDSIAPSGSISSIVSLHLAPPSKLRRNVHTGMHLRALRESNVPLRYQLPAERNIHWRAVRCRCVRDDDGTWVMLALGDRSCVCCRLPCPSGDLADVLWQRGVREWNMYLLEGCNGQGVRDTYVHATRGGPQQSTFYSHARTPPPRRMYTHTRTHVAASCYARCQFGTCTAQDGTCECDELHEGDDCSLSE